MAQLRIHTPQVSGIPHGRTAPVAAVLSAFAKLVKWEAVRRNRQRLKDLDAHLLDDIGVTRDLAHKEATRPFWQG